MQPLLIALLVLAIVMTGGLFGSYLRSRLPQHHLDGDSRDTAKVAIGFVTTLAALVLGLMLSSAKNSFDAQSADVQTAAADVALLDYNLRLIGSSAEPARQELRQFVSGRMQAIWGESALQPGTSSIAGTTGFQALAKTIMELKPSGEAEHSAWLKAMQVVDKVAELRALTITSIGSAVMPPLLMVLVFWLTVIAVGLNTFAPRNLTVAVLNFVCALSGTAAIFLILELDIPFQGIIHVSPAPLQAALLQLSQN
jgi:hypothetical protein